MIKDRYNLVIIGGGPAGLAASYSAYTSGVKDILLIERDDILGGILNQCIHNGFGLHKFKEELTGPEYAARYIELVKKSDIQVLTSSIVIDIDSNKNVYVVTSSGIKNIKAQAIILAMGCRERNRGAILVPGSRVAGIYTAGQAQKFVNNYGYLVGKKIVILGSGDIGLIMARRMTLEGAKVLGVVEICPYSNGLNRNIVQCLNDYNIPLYLSHTISDIKSDNIHQRISSVIVSKVDENKNIISGSEKEIKCDTLLLSIGLIPENELSKKAGVILDKKTKGAIVKDNLETSVEGIFSCGNVLQVHDLVDNVSIEGEKAGISAASYINNKKEDYQIINVNPGNNLLYACPQKIILDNQIEANIFFRVKKPITSAVIEVVSGSKLIKTIKKIKIIPSEMEKISINKDDIKSIKEIEIRVVEAKDD